VRSEPLTSAIGRSILNSQSNSWYTLVSTQAIQACTPPKQGAVVELPQFPILRNRVRLAAALAFCIYAALPASLTTLKVPPTTLLLWKRDPAMIIGSTLLMFFFALYARRSAFLGDRVFFGIAAGSCLLWDIRYVVLPGAVATSFINGVVNVLWAIGAIVTLVLLLSDSRPRTAR
jgi:hypothetical protein